MADLEKLLLEAAGRTTTGRNRHSPPPSRRRRKGSYSDDGSDSNNDRSDGDRPYSNRKPSGSQVPLKKRLDPTDRDDDRSSQEGGDSDRERERDSDNDSVGSDLYKDENDREKLSKLTELERELILEERATKRSDRDLTEKLKKRKGPERKGSPPKAHARNTRAKAQRAGALDELVKRRRDAAKGSGGRYSPVKRRTFTSAALSSPSRSESGSQSDDGDSTGMVDSDEDNKKSAESKVPTYEDIKEITIRRSKLSKWFMEPFFDELIVGCFVRVGIGRSRSGPIYRLCMVRNVDATDPDRQYKLDNKNTHKYLNVTWGNESSAARWQMAMVSDSPPIKEEFDQWAREVDRNGGHMPTKEDVLEKKEAIKKTNLFVYSAATVKHMLQEKKSATRRPLNIAAEKDRLRRDLEIAKENKDEAEIERINARLEELEATRKTQEQDSKAVKLAEMNRRNRVDNFKNASGLKPVNTGLKAGEAGYDPFSRRWTRSRNYYVGKSNTSNETNGEAVADVVATVEALEAAADAGKLVDTSAPVDEGTESNLLHNFELPISLAVLQKFGGPQGAQAGFMARKQRIEATVGVQVPENDGRRHALTLTVSDYKRRRGLL